MHRGCLCAPVLLSRHILAAEPTCMLKLRFQHKYFIVRQKKWRKEDSSCLVQFISNYYSQGTMAGGDDVCDLKVNFSLQVKDHFHNLVLQFQAPTHHIHFSS